MSKARFTDVAIRAMVSKSATKDHSVTDPLCPGLRLRMRPGREPAWEHVFMVGGKSRRHSLGPYPDVSLAAARKAVEHNRREVKEGAVPTSPTASRKAARDEAAAAEQKAMDFSKLFWLWHGLELQGQRDGGTLIANHFERHVLPLIGGVAVEEVTRKRVMEVIDSIKKKGSMRVANVVLQNMKRVFNFAELRELVKSNPAALVERKDAGGREYSRERFLKEGEITQLFNALPGSDLEARIEAAIWVLMSTLVRVGALYAAKWRDINLDLDIREPVWRVWDEKKRIQVLYEVPLTRFAQRHLRAIRNEQLRRGVETEWVMYSPDDPQKHALASGMNKQLRDRQDVSELSGRVFNASLKLPGGRWTPHDLRRTGSSRMKALGVPAEVRRACMNHTPPDKLEETYDREEIPMRVRREAFEKLAKNLEGLTTQKGRPEQSR